MTNSNIYLESTLPRQSFRFLSSSRWIVIIYLAIITLAEGLTTFGFPRPGLVLHAVLLAALLLHSVWLWEHGIHRLLLPMIFAPLIRLMSLSLPLSGFDRIYWYFIVSIPLFIIVPMMSRLLEYNWTQLGFTLHKPMWQIVAILSGLVFGITEYLILRPEPFISDLTLDQILIPALILLFATGLFEELIFRSLMQQSAEELLGKWWALIYASAIFMVLHIGYKSFVDLMFVFSAGFIWGFIWIKTRSVIGITIGHGITNILLFLVAPFLPFMPPPQRPAGAPAVGLGISVDAPIISVPNETTSGVGLPNWLSAISLPPLVQTILVVGLIWLIGAVLIVTVGRFWIRWLSRRDSEFNNVSQKSIPQVIHENYLRNPVDWKFVLVDEIRDAPTYSVPYVPMREETYLLRHPLKVLVTVAERGKDSQWAIKVDLYGDLIVGRKRSDIRDLMLGMQDLSLNTSFVSKTHLLLHPTPNGLYLYDLNTTNRTAVNGMIISPDTPIKLREHNEIMLGSTLIMTLRVVH